MRSKSNDVMMSPCDRHGGQSVKWWVFILFNWGHGLRDVALNFWGFCLHLCQNVESVILIYISYESVDSHTPRRIFGLAFLLFTWALMNFRKAWLGGLEVGEWFSFIPVAANLKREMEGLNSHSSLCSLSCDECCCDGWPWKLHWSADMTFVAIESLPGAACIRAEMMCKNIRLIVVILHCKRKKKS